MYVMAFVTFAGGNVALETCVVVLCAYIAPAAARSGKPEVKAFLNGVDAHSILAPSTLFVKMELEKSVKLELIIIMYNDQLEKSVKMELPHIYRKMYKSSACIKMPKERKDCATSRSRTSSFPCGSSPYFGNIPRRSLCSLVGK
ncbi:hypothetical protein AgCh_021513 [Apium graveolens]